MNWKPFRQLKKTPVFITFVILTALGLTAFKNLTEFRSRAIVNETAYIAPQCYTVAEDEDGTVSNTWVPRRPIPDCDAWFETTWAEFRSGEVFNK